MKRSKNSRLYVPTPKLRVRATRKLRATEEDKSFISDNISGHDNTDDIPEYNDTEYISNFRGNTGEAESLPEMTNEEFKQQLPEHNMDINDNYQPSDIDTTDTTEEILMKNIDDSHRSLLDIVEEDEEDDSMNNSDVLEEESSNFEGFDSEYGPYFPNFTSTMIFIWITKHMISTSAYEDLAKILTHPEYRKEDITKNIRQIRKWRDRLPLVKVRKHDVPLSMQRTPSTYASTKKAFTISPLTHLERILKNPLIMPKMYFGPGIVANEKREFWHGELWQDSLLFGENKIRITNEEFYKAGEFLIFREQSSTFMCRVRSVVNDEMDNNTLKLKVDMLLKHEKLPNCRPNDNRHTRGNNMELWLVEGEAKLVNPTNVVQHIVVWLCDMPEPDEYDFYIKEIVYSFDSRWKYRDIASRHRLPYENITIMQSQQNLPILKVFLDIYVDDFGTYRNVYHSLGGVYLQIGNMPSTLRKQLKNHFLIGFVPFGANFNDFIKPIVQDIKSLENGRVMQTLYGDAWVIGGIGCVTADLPQGNDLAAVKRHGANHGCRTCNVSNDQYTDPNYNYIKNARFQQQTNERIAEIESQHLRMDQDRLATKYGLIKPGPLNDLKWNQHLQTPQDAYHSMAGKARTLLEVTFNIFNTNGENDFLEYWKRIEKPSHWSRMPNPLRHRQSFMFSDVLRLAMLMPFILQRFLESRHIKTDALNNWHKNSGIRRNLVASKLCACWAIEAKALKLAFSTTMTENTYQELQETLKKEREILIQIFPDTFTNLPNLHVNMHLLQHARNFATLVNTAVGVKEMVHRIFKTMVPHMNCKEIELDLTRRYNTIQALRHLIDGWTDPRFNTRPNALPKLIADPNIYTILTAWYATENFNTINSQEFEDKQDDDNITICCHNSNFIDISLNSRWSAKKVNDRGLSKKLDYKHPFFQDISVSYREHFNSKEAILNRKLEFYNSISYTVLKDGQDPIRLKIHIGDIVELPEESEGIAYAKVKSIFRHQANNGQYYAFFFFDWFQATNIMDSVLECPFYNIQKPEESRWFQIFPITFIDRNPCVFFIHNCGNTCNTEHDEENRSYILNRYYYNAV
ncbi:hypothetical protein RhiirA1_446940 [Rhizophagus irregularis]|uniref:BAH domain-containing protein n=1 Tax=Rhizophagus irregularis TaxID=588596 RepID=A0A2N0QVB9_9GLOM|nr:hypothetical protein RhiirA1_446940 [Rhizophagus irregularis]